MKKLFLAIVLLVVFGTANAMTAFFVREEPSEIFNKKVCVYNYQGHEIGLLRSITSLCPLSVEMD